MKTETLFVLILIFLLLISGCSKKTEIIHSTVEKTEDLKNQSGQKIGDIKINIGANISVTSSCGDMKCFEDKFSQCKPATVTSKLTDNLVYYYEIIGPKDGLCQVKSKFIENPNPEWVNKEMTCRYDNSKDFNTAVQDLSKCEGQLYNLMTGG